MCSVYLANRGRQRFFPRPLWVTLFLRDMRRTLRIRLRAIDAMHHTVEGFHVTSYRANLESHHTRDRHVGFLLVWNGMGKHNKMAPLLFN